MAGGGKEMHGQRKNICELLPPDETRRNEGEAGNPRRVREFSFGHVSLECLRDKQHDRQQAPDVFQDPFLPSLF